MASDELDEFRARSRSFGAAAQAYASYRPGYPDRAVDWALRPMPRPGDHPVLDLGAGTGKLTASLTARFDRVVAVEPDEQMLEVVRELLPEASAIAGGAERIPLADDFVDAVLVGQAFHWFDPEQAGPEIARVLRPRGVLAALWNAEDTSVDWVAGYHLAAFGRPRGNGVPAGAEREDLPGAPWFGPTERQEFSHSQRLTVEGLLDVVATHSWALVADPSERERAFDRVRDYFAGRPELTDSADGAFDLPLRTMVLRAVRLEARR